MESDESDRDPTPDGYALYERHSPVTEPWAPVFFRDQPQSVWFSLRVRNSHCNSRSSAHGGLLTAIADLAMGRSAIAAALHAGFPVGSAMTLSLAIDFLEAPGIGMWLEWKPEVLRVSKTLAVVECHIVARASPTIARANGTFRIIAP